MFGEIEKFMNSSECSGNYRIVNLGGNVLYIEGVKAVVGFGESEMRFQLNNCLLTIAGSELKVKYLDKSTCVLVGKISSVVTS